MRTHLFYIPAKGLFVPILLSLFFSISFCSNEKIRGSVNDFTAWVKAHKDSVDHYADREWNELDDEFNLRKSDLDKEVNRMDKNLKATYDKSLKEWDIFKAEYLTRHQERIMAKRKSALDSTLFQKGIKDDFSNLTPQNIAGEYEHFVKTVNNNRDEYTNEEWQFIDHRWKELNHVEERMEDHEALSQKDSRKITGLKLEYAGIKALNKPFAD